MEKKNNQLRFIIATFFLFAVLFLAQPAHAASPNQDPLTFIASRIEAVINFVGSLVQSFLAFLAQLFGA